MRRTWMDRLFPGRSGWIERAARDGLDAYARELDGVPRAEAERDPGLAEDATKSADGSRTPSFA